MTGYFKIFILSFFALNIYGQNNKYIKEFITTSQGLSHNYVTSIISDDLNIKWIGTENGITKYNGYDFEYIKPGQKHKDLLNENIEVLFKDKDSNIWIGTKSGGLSYIDTQNNITKNVNHLIDVTKEGISRITALSQDEKGNIWVGTFGDGVYVIDFLNNTLVSHFTFMSPVYSIVKDFKGYMWFPMGNQLAKYIAKDDRLHMQNIPGIISCLISDPSRNKLWISTLNNNPYIYNYDYSTGLIEAVKTNVRSNFTKQLSIDKNHRIWIGTWGKGVYRSNAELTEFNKIKLVHRNSEKINANYNNVLKILHDKNNITWLATGNGGVVKLIEGNGFDNASELIKNNDLIENFNITTCYKESNKLFIGTAYNGLFYGDSFSNLKQLNETKNTRINTLYQHAGRLYIGCNSGFYIFSIEEEKVVFSNKSIKLNPRLTKVTAFHIDKSNNLYIGTQQRGFAIVNLEDINNSEAYKKFSNSTGSFKNIGSDRITGIKEDKNGLIWMSTYNGLYLFDIEKKKLINQRFLLKEKLPSVIINYINIQDEYIWLATPGGLIKLSYNNGKLKTEDKITKENGLNSDFVCGVLFDKNSNLWISTHTEIVKYTPSDKSIISYGRINGINTTSFNNGCVFNYNETFYFGGIDNITFFEPQNITNTNTVPEIIFTNLRVNNNLVQYDTENKILDKNVNYATKIKLSYRDQFFSVGFVANDYLGNLNIKYRYLLDGYQKDWIDLHSRNEINFTGLSSGNYKLKIEATRDNQTWSKPKSIDIVLLGSPWKSPLALVFYTLLIILIAAYFLKLYKDKLKLRNNLQLARIDKKREIEVAESKLAFFTNISHEFRTPLTLIRSPLQEILEYKDLTPKITNKLRYIDKNTNKLLDLINQLLDFRKADHGHLKLNLSQGDFIEFSKEVQLYFKEAAKSKNVKLKFKSKLDNIKFLFDRNKMEIVLSNLLSNAIKHTSEGDKIVMSIDTDGKFCQISIKDTGIGMNAQNIDRIFERFFQIKSANTAKMTGSGIGLYFSKKIIELHKGSIDVKSKENIGTEFVIKLFMDQKLIDSEINEIEISTDSKEQNHTLDVETPAENLLDSKAQTVLIIDDNLDILNYLEEVLSDTYKIIKANNGDLGFKMATSNNPDLVVSDVMMPIKDGITLCKELKSQFITSHIPVILLTARSSSLFEIEGLKTGADDYITKPFNASIVKARIASLLENRVKLRAHFLNKVRFEPTSKVAPDSNSDRDNSFINNAMLLVEKNLDNPSFGIEIMVDQLNMSQSTLYRKIKSLTGLSLTAFIRSIRLKKAAALILTEDLNLKQIAYEVGFNDYKYFTDTFKVQFKCLPSKYKESLERV